jgi:hypothetical protein
MPQLDDIEQFKEVLESLGSEKEIQDKKGEAIEDIPPPEQGLSSDLTDLLGISDQEIEMTPPASEPESAPPSPEGEEIKLSDLESISQFELPPEAPPADFTEEPPLKPDLPSGEEPAFELPKEFEQEITQAKEVDFGLEQAEQPPAQEAGGMESITTPPIAEEEIAATEIPAAKDAAFTEFELPDISDITEPPIEEKEVPSQALEEDIFAGLTDLDSGAAAAAETPISEEKAEAKPEEAAAPLKEEPPSEKGPKEEFSLDEFSLPDFAAEHGLGEEEMAPPEPSLEPPLEEEELAPPLVPPAGEFLPAAEDIELSDKEFKSLQDTLAGLPLNLKLIIEELIGEKELKGNNLRKLLDLLIEGQSPREIAAYVGTLIGKKIVLPKRFEKKTGVAFEREKESLAYILKRKLTPAFLIAAVAVFALIALSLFGYQFIYRPLAALSVYQEGYDKVEQGDYLNGNQKFEEATQIWDYKDQYYRFAEVFRKKEQYKFAEQKYAALLAKYPYDEKGALDYADLLSLKGSYAEANTILNKHILGRELFHFKGLLAAGDNFLRWGDQDSKHYEDALRAYQQLHERYPGEEEVMFRLLNYFIHTNNPVQVDWYKNYFKDKNYGPVNPEIYTRLAGYLIDRNELDDVKDILDKARSANGELPEIYYELGRYYTLVHETNLEAEVLKATPDIFRNYFAKHPDKKTSERTAMLIKAHNRLGEYYYNQKDYQELPKAEKEFSEAIKLYEIEKRNRTLGIDKSFGKIYANLGDIYYHIDENFTLALEMYNQAEDNLYNEPEMKYKKGYIYYKRNDYENAMLEFYGAAANMRNNHVVLFALANTLYKRKDYSSALGNYIYLLELLEDEKNAIPLLRPEDNPLHNALMEKHYLVLNNLGVTYFQLGKGLHQPEKETQALVELEKSAEIFDVLSRNPDTMARLQSTNTATQSIRVKKPAPEPYANMDIILHAKNLELVIYEDLPMDVDQTRLRKKDQL